jgi:hypothetical protein
LTDIAPVLSRLMVSQAVEIAREFGLIFLQTMGKTNRRERLKTGAFSLNRETGSCPRRVFRPTTL